MRFLADESVSRLVVERLRSGGHEVMHIAEAKPGASDAHVLEVAANAGSILITEIEILASW